MKKNTELQAVQDTMYSRRAQRESQQKREGNRKSI
jgi:hypothetical protein